MCIRDRREADIQAFASKPFYVPEITCGGFTASGEKLSGKNEAEKICMDCDGPVSYTHLDVYKETAVVGASRRFLAQITRHQNEVKFMSASLQYSNYTGQADFAVPYEILACLLYTSRCV